MSGRGWIWAGRIAAVTVFAVLHLMVFGALVAVDLGHTLSRGPNGEELGYAYRESAQGRRIDLIIDTLEWPLFKPVQMAGRHLSTEVAQSRPWKLAEEASLYANSVIWGIGIWLLLRWLLAGMPLRLRGSSS